MMKQKDIYADFAAASPVKSAVLRAMEPFWQEKFANPNGLTRFSQQSRQVIEDCRARVARILGVNINEIIFTSGATEANNMALAGLARTGRKIAASAIEHPSVLNVVDHFQGSILGVLPDGRLDTDKYNPKIDVVSVGYINHEIGTVQKISDIKSKLTVINPNVILHSDASQAPQYLPLAVNRMAVDMMTLNGGKIGGPKGVGCLYLKKDISLEPILLGGDQEFSKRAGTENVALIVGFTLALEIAHQNYKQNNAKVQELKNIFLSKLRDLPIEHTLNSPNQHVSPHIINVSFDDMDGERMLMELDELGVQVATGSACTASSDLPSHVLSAIGRTIQQANSSLRFSFSPDMSQEDILRIIQCLNLVIANKL
jgi:cysteine desulfurase